MIYHYNDNDNVLLPKMFQILGKYNIKFKYAPTFNERKVGAYSRREEGEGTNLRHYGTIVKKSFFKTNNKFAFSV